MHLEDFFLPPNIFEPQLVEFADTELIDVESQLCVVT